MVAEGPRQTRLKNVTELQGKHFTTHTFVIFTAVVIRGGVVYLTSRLSHTRIETQASGKQSDSLSSVMGSTLLLGTKLGPLYLENIQYGTANDLNNLIIFNVLGLTW